MEQENTIQYQAGGVYCTVCKNQFEFTKPSKIQRHIESNVHRKNVSNQYGQLQTQNNSFLSRENIAVRLSWPVKEIPNTQEQSYPDNEIIIVDKSISLIASDYNKCNVGTGSTQPNSSGGLFRSPRKTRQQELEEKIQFLESQLNELSNNNPNRSNFTISDLPSGVGSANKLAQEDFHKQCNKLIEEKNTTILELKGRMNKLEGKLEMKENELMLLKQQIDGQESIKLKIKLGQLKVRLEERDKQLLEVKEQLKEWTDTANKLINSRADFDEWQTKFRQMSAPNSVIPTPDQSIGCSQDDFVYSQIQSDNEDEQMQIINTREEERKENDVVFTCPYCTLRIIGPPHIMRVDDGIIQIGGALHTHWQDACSYFDEYHRKLKIVAAAVLESQQQLLQPEVQLTLQQDRDKVIQCLKLSVVFDQSNTELKMFLNDWKINRKESYPFAPINIDNDADVSVTNELGLLQQFYRLNQQHSYHKSEGYMRWVDGKLVNVTQQIMENSLILEKLKQFRYRCTACKKLFQCEIGWREHSNWMINCGRTCTCDVFSFAKYSHSLEGTSVAKFKRDIESKELKRLEELITTTMKKPELIEPEKFKSTLETKRDIQREDSISFINGTKEQLMPVEGWLATLAQQCEKGELKALGTPICDAIVYPRCPLVFGSEIHKHDHELMLFLKSHGIAIKTVGNTAKSDPTVAFVYLLDNDNEYTAELMQKFQRSLDDLASKISNAVPRSELQEGIIQTELANLYIRQTDYTKDYLSFLIVKSLNKNFDVLRQIGERIGIPFSEAHSQLSTSIQFQSFVEDASGKQVRVQRLKAYNKWVHLLLTTSFKAALSMGTSKLFKGPAAFHMNKLQPSFNDGLLRIELSSYYYSVEQWKNEALQMQQWNNTISSMERALQEVDEQLLYKVSLRVFWDSFWFSIDAATVIIDLQADLWTVVYAYSSRSYLFTGHYTDKHAKSGAQLTFLQRFTGTKTLVRVSNGQQSKQFLLYRHGHHRQIPIGSLNVKQVEENRMPIDMSTWFYHLSKEQLNQTYFVCDNQEEFDEWFGQDPALARPDVNEFENHVDQYMHDNDNEQSFQERSVSHNITPQVEENKKRRIRNRSRSRSQDEKTSKPTKSREKSKSMTRNEEAKYHGVLVDIIIKKKRMGNVLLQNQIEFNPHGSGGQYTCSQQNCPALITRVGKNPPSYYLEHRHNH